MANEPLSTMFREFVTEVQHSGRHGRQNDLKLGYNMLVCCVYSGSAIVGQGACHGPDRIKLVRK